MAADVGDFRFAAAALRRLFREARRSGACCMRDWRGRSSISRARPIVLTTRPIGSFSWAKTCSTKARPFDIASFFAERQAVSSQTSLAVLSRSFCASEPRGGDGRPVDQVDAGSRQAAWFWMDPLTAVLWRRDHSRSFKAIYSSARSPDVGSPRSAFDLRPAAFTSILSCLTCRRNARPCSRASASDMSSKPPGPFSVTRPMAGDMNRKTNRALPRPSAWR